MPEVIKIKELKNGLKVAELFHGPTLAFKDLALGVVGGLYNYFLERSKKKCIVIVGKQHEAWSTAFSTGILIEILNKFLSHLLLLSGKVVISLQPRYHQNYSRIPLETSQCMRNSSGILIGKAADFTQI